MQNWFVLIHYVDNQVGKHKQQLLCLAPIDDLMDFSNDDVDRIINKFVAHNFNLDANWDLYYYVTGLNDSQSPFYYRTVRDCILSPFTAPASPRFVVDDDVDAEAGSLGTTNMNEGSSMPPKDSPESLNRSASALNDDEPEAVLDRLMDEHKRKGDDNHGTK